MRLLAVLALCLATVFSAACAGGQGAPAGEGEGERPEEPGSGESFTGDEYGEVVSDPDAHVGARVNIVGRLLESPETRDGETAFQMFADPENSDWNTVVVTDENVPLEADDYARVHGEVVGSVEGENAFGATLTLPQVEASSVTPVDAVEALDPAKATLDEGGTITDPAGFSVTLEKMEFGERTTRVYLKARNDTGYPASFYSFNSRIIQGSRQIEPDDTMSYEFGLEEPQSDISPGVETEGVVVYGPVDPNQPFEVRFEWSSENYEITPGEIVFRSG